MIISSFYFIIIPDINVFLRRVTAKINYRHYLGCEINQQMKHILEDNIENVTIWEDYVPYKNRLISHEEMIKIDSDYKKAYSIYCQEIEKEE